MTLRVTVKQVMAWKPCYSNARIRELFGRRRYLDAKQVLDLDIPDEDKLWAVLCPELIDATTLRLLACDFTERSLRHRRRAGRKPDPRLWNAIKVSRRYAKGKAMWTRTVNRRRS